ncbi:TetR/AcrR family transcriptional regulator [Rapidithrix thailandica]|uniref:TetR/AcrR family transcriptional regulator n=1 Tax=Rapidithrix thailandica TaxID=413964 RepID=A0AAW9S831_9BACT
MGKREEKINTIIHTTISLLGKEGSGSLSMRKVAEHSKITLSNLQYYFKDKDELLSATIGYYFKLCEEEVVNTLEKITKSGNADLQPFLKELLMMHLVDGHPDEKCTMFREIWALSTRNPKIEQVVFEYYQTYCKWIVKVFASYSSHPQAVTSLLLPYIEGYSVMGKALPLGKAQVIDLLMNALTPFYKRPGHTEE